MNEYQSSALEEAVAAIAILIITSIIYFALNKNKNIFNKVLTCIFPLVFVSGEVYALFASSHYITGTWAQGSYIQNEFSSILNYILIGIYILGFIMSIYTVVKYKGPKLIKFSVAPILLVATYLFFVSAMTLSRDWI